MQRILIVDDLPDNLYLLETLLKGNGFEVVSAPNGSAALASARDTPPDLVISDILMPIMDGYALCRAWRGDSTLKSVPFVFYTATFVDRADEELALGLGADRFLVKPQEPEVLMDCVRELLSETSAPRRDPPFPPQEKELLLEYNEALFRKLEKKMQELERTNRELLQRMEEQKRLEEQLRQAHKMEAVGRFSAGIAHDFNNLLTVIMGFGSVLRMQYGEDPKLRDSMDRILEAADRAKSLTGTLLTFSRKQPVRLERLDLNRVVSGMELFLKRVIGDDVAIKVDLFPGPLLIMADKGHLEQILMNLAVNARDAMPRGGVLAIETGVADAGSSWPRAELAVSDTGVGMDEAVRQQIFEPFFTTKEVDRGTGLGLSIVYGIVQQHGGEILVSSAPGAGATFRTLFPLLAATAENAPPPEPEPPLPGGAGTILVVDNEKGIRDYLSQFLTTLGYRVVTAEDGDEASRLFRTRRFDLVLMDAIMPNKNGKEAAREMLQVDPGVRILFMSGYPFDEKSAGSLLPENAQVLRKPLAPSELAQKVRAVLER